MNLLPDATPLEGMEKAIARAVEAIAFRYDLGTPEYEAAMILLRHEVRTLKARHARVNTETARRYEQDADRWRSIKEP